MPTLPSTNRATLRLLACVLLSVIASGCTLFEGSGFSGSRPIPVATAPAADSTKPGYKTIWVVGHGWHTGLVVRSQDVSSEILPEANRSLDSEFVELGWGDEGFYSADRITLPLVAKALLVPTPSVLHVAGFNGQVTEVFTGSDIVAVQVADREFDQMCRFISETFERTETGQSTPLGPGLYGDSTFYRAAGNYYAPKTCNVWTAKALKRAGLRISPQLATTEEGVMLQVRRFGRSVQKASKGRKKSALGLGR